MLIAFRGKNKNWRYLLMNKDLTVSQIDRQNILNNDMALEEIKNQTKIQGIFLKTKFALQNLW